MALQVWLPLNGNLNNQGLDNATVTNSGATVDNNGKIGKCYLFSASSAKITNTLSSSVTSAVGTMSCWVKFNSFPASGAWYCLMQLGTAGGFANCRLGLYMQYQTGIVVCINGSSDSNLYTHSLVTNQWYHLCTTFDGTTVRLYIDGMEVWNKTAVVGSYTTAASTLFVGGTNNYYFKGYMNDVRYYSTALSPREIELLSRGLVCHYPLEGANNTLLPFGYQQLEYIESAGAAYFDTGYKFNPETDSFKVEFKGNDTANNGMILGSNGGKYTWMYYYGSNGIRMYASNGSQQQSIAGITSDTNKHIVEYKSKHYWADGVDKGSFSNTYIEEPNSMSMFSYGGANYVFKGRIYYCNICRNGKPQRVYVPAKRISDSKIGMYDIINNTFKPSDSSTAFTAGSVVGTPSTVYDTSGYQYNGTVNGTILNSTDTARYSMSTEFSKTGHIANSSFGLTTNAFTVNFWVKLKTASSQHFVLGTFDNWTSNGFGLYRETNGTTYQSLIRSTAENTYKQHTMTLTGSVWQMLTYIYTGTHYKGYLNGVLKFDDTYGSNGNVSHPALVIANSYFNGTPASENEEAFLSDFRFYATALSDSQVAELYNTAVSVANNGTLMGYELVES